MSNFIKLIISILVCQFAGIIGSFFISGSISGWYETLNKPSFTPPPWIFGPVWIILYLMMGFALFQVWKEGFKNKTVRIAIIIFIIQLIFNTAWSIIFFGLNSIPGGLVTIVILWVLIVLTIVRFIKISKTAGILLIPYFLWVTFAAVLNFYIYNLN